MPEPAAPDYPGRCHCGAIGFAYRPSVPPPEWSVRACQCRFCRAHAAFSTSDPQGSLAFVAREEDQLARYRFGLKTADFLLCRRCGVYVGAVIATDRGDFGIVNTRALETEPADMAAVGAISYEGEDAAGRSDRRVARWTPVTSWPRP